MAVDWNQAEVERRIRAGAKLGVLIGAQEVHARAVELIMEPPKTGRVYRRRGVEHQASAPGEAPASDTGRLAGSGTVVYDAENIAARVNFATIYARRLEVGDDKIEPRPYARRALAEKVQEIQDAVKDQIDKALKE
jgi:hypothetical protein